MYYKGHLNHDDLLPLDRIKSRRTMKGKYPSAADP